MIEAAAKKGVKKFILLTSIGVGDSSDAPPKQVYEVLKPVLIEKGKAEEKLKVGHDSPLPKLATGPDPHISTAIIHACTHVIHFYLYTPAYGKDTFPLAERKNWHSQARAIILCLEVLPSLRCKLLRCQAMTQGAQVLVSMVTS